MKDPTPQESSQPAAIDNPSSQNNILVLGNSISAGYGLTLEQAFPFLIKKKIDSLGLPYEVINAGLSGETTEAGVNRLPWLLRQPISILVIELGGNDGLRGIPPEETEAN
ncbi:MAG: GDSL-type esterase/lipase family protein, partial [Bacteroidota bacterium]